MTEITVRYHHEGATWWAESDDLPGFTAAGDSLSEVRREVREGVAFHFDLGPDDQFDLLEVMAGSDAVVASLSVSISAAIGVGVWGASPAPGTFGAAADYQIVASAMPSPTLRSQLVA